MKSSTKQYWILQFVGWGGWMLLNVFFVYFFGQEFLQGERGRVFITVLLIQFSWYIFATHLLRSVLIRISWIQLPMNRIIPVFIAGVLFTGMAAYYGSKATAKLTNNSLAEFEKRAALERAITLEKMNNLSTDYYKHLDGPSADSTAVAIAARIKQGTGWQRDELGKWMYESPRAGRFWWDIIFTFILMALWLAMYMARHYLLRNQKDKLDRVNLEKTVKELEIKTIKSHINPHFIFNALNSIRALVEENPKRARTAITELSNILRSSLQMEKLETIPLEKELDIVKDYLALEQIRFEERLQINFDIDEKALQQPVPPMMLQTLVENAIKHGISKQIHGGIINIKAVVSEKHFEISVQNTGRMDDEVEGFGIKSTRDRLHFLYDGNAVFQISNLDDNLVETVVIIPAVKILFENDQTNTYV